MNLEKATEQPLIEKAKKIEVLIAAKAWIEARKEADEFEKDNQSAGLAYKGIIALKTEQYDQAETFLLESFRLNEKQNIALANLIPTYLKKRDFKKAAAFGEQAYAVLPKNLSIAINYCSALLQEQKYSLVIDILEKFYDESNPNWIVLSGLVAAYRSLFMRDQAEKYLKIAEENFGEKPEIARLRADTLAERSPMEALNAFETAIKLDPTNIASRWNMSLVQLRLGRFKEGWENYDNGLLPEVGKIGRPLPLVFEGLNRITNKNDLDPTKWTIAVCEQGIGDQVLFLGCFEEFLREFPKTILVAEKRFEPILKRSFKDLAIYSYGGGQIFAANNEILNGFMPIGSMQKNYRNSRQKFLKNRRSYLTPDGTKVIDFRETILKKTGAEKIIGFSWKGGFWERAQKTKTLEIELWEPIFQKKDVIFISLQYGDVTKEHEYLKNKYKNIRWIDGMDFKKDLDGWFSLICACDEIVSVSTALVHFAGAAGKKVNLLLSELGAPFIWGLEDTESIAYNNFRIFRKSATESHDVFFKDVASKIYEG